jgi:WD40 repeat protein/serine/threonine protein kinase
MACPEEIALAGYVDGTATGARHAEIDEHIDTCESCRVAIGVLVAMRRAARSRLNEGDAPADPTNAGSAATVLTREAVATTLDPAAIHGPPSAATTSGPFQPVPPGAWDLGPEIASGGMGLVRRAHDTRLDREVAVKELLADTPERAARFEREVLITARLQHPSIVTIHAAGRLADGRPFYAMKLVDGQPLEEVVKRTANLADRLALVPRVLTVVEALAYAHGKRVIHRDLKPSNVLVGQFGETVVIDWGLAKDLAAAAAKGANGGAGDAGLLSAPPQTPSSSTETVAGAVLGTPSYMAPEQADGKSVSERADVYSLGAMLYHVLAGAPPYQAKSSAEVIAAVRAGPPSPLEVRAPQAPAELCAIVRRAMARDPVERYPTAREMADDLRAFLNGQLVGSHRYTTWQRVRRWAGRHRVLLTTITGALIAGATVAAISIHRVVAAEHAKAAEADLLAKQQATDHASYLASLQGQAFQSLAAGEPMKAAALLVPVFNEKPNDPGVRFMVARAVATIDPLLHTLTGHSGPVRYATFSPDGTRIVTTSDDGTAREWDATTGELLFTLTGHTKVVWQAAFSPDGARIATAGGDRTLRLWDAHTGAPLAVVDDPAGQPVNAVAFSPDGKSLVTGGRAGAATLWDAGTAQVTTRARLLGHTDSVWTVAFSPDGATVATGSEDGTIKVWDARTGQLQRSIGGNQSGVWALGFSPDGTTLVSAGEDKVVRIFDTRTFELRRSLGGFVDSIDAAFYCGGSQLLVVAGWDGLVTLWDPNTGLNLGTLEGHTGPVNMALCDPAGQRIVSASFDRTARIWQVPLSARLPVLDAGPHPAQSVVYSPDGTRLAMGSDDGNARLFDARSGQLLATMPGPGSVFRAIFSPDGARLATSTLTGSARIWDALTGRLLLTLTTSPSPYAAIPGIAFSPNDNGRHLVTVGSPGVRMIFDSVSGQTLQTFPEIPGVGEMLVGVTYSHDGTRIAFGSAEGMTRVVTADTGAELLDLPLTTGQVQSLEFSPDDRWLATISGKNAQVYDSRTGAPAFTLQGQRGNLTSVDYSPDGAFLLTASQDGTARLWSATDGTPLDELDGKQEGLAGASFSPDGKSIATASLAGTVKQWAATLETRPPAQIEALVRERVPYEVVDGRLVPRAVPSPASAP